MANPFKVGPAQRLNRVRAAIPALLDDLQRVEADAQAEQDTNNAVIQELGAKNAELRVTKEKARDLAKELEFFQGDY